MTADQEEPTYKIQPGDTVGAIDCGSNAVRFSLFTFTDEPGLPEPQRHRFAVRLGAGTFDDGNLAEADMDAAIEALREIAALAKNHDVIALPAVATSAIREARNSVDFLDRVRTKTGIEMRTIPGDEEARLVALGVCAEEELESDALIIDIGGGSTEIIHCNRAGEIIHAESIPLGAVRLARQAGMPAHYSESVSDELQGAVFSQISEVLDHFELPEEIELIGVGGTASCLVKAAKSLDLTTDNGIDLESLDSLLLQLQEMPTSQYHSFADISEERSSIIYPGAIILLTLMMQSGCADLRLSDAGLREGLVQDLLNRLR